MTTLLQINASINNGNGESSRLANQFVAAFHKRFLQLNFVRLAMEDQQVRRQRCGHHDPEYRPLRD